MSRADVERLNPGGPWGWWNRVDLEQARTARAQLMERFREARPLTDEYRQLQERIGFSLDWEKVVLHLREAEAR